MRVMRLVRAIAIPIVTLWVGLAAGSAHAEQAAAPDPAEAKGVAPMQGTSRARPPQSPAERAMKREVWWTHAREVLFRDIQLSPEQASQVDAIIASQREGLVQLDGIRTELAAAEKAGDAKRVGELRAEMRRGRAKLKSPRACIDEMRELLSDAERPTFDMNRAHLVAERQQSRQARPGRKTRRKSFLSGWRQSPIGRRSI